MTDRRTEDYAFANNISNGEAKRRLRSGATAREARPGDLSRAGGGPVAGTGKPKGASKG